MHFHAQPLTFKGQKVGGIYGLIRTIISSYNPQIYTSVVVFDYDRESNFRVQLDASYKSHRAASDPDIHYNLKHAIIILQSLGIRVYKKQGYEADDVIGTLATIWAARGYQIKIFSQDKDFIQLVNPSISIVSKNRVITIDNWERHISVAPWQFRDYLVICGDAADNIKGIKGIGPVGATALLKEYGDLKTLYHMLENGQGEFKLSVRKKLEASRAEVQLGQKLVTICCNIHDLNTAIHKDSAPDYPLALAQLRELHMFALARKLQSVQEKEAQITQLGVDADIHVSNSQHVALQTKDCLHRTIACISTPKNFEISISPEEQYTIQDVEAVVNFLRSASNIITYDVKKELKNFSYKGWSMATLAWEDLHVMRYLVNGQHDTGTTLEDLFSIYGTNSLHTLFNRLEQKLEILGLKRLYHIELRIAHLLYFMETRGIKVHRPRLSAKCEEVKLQLLAIEKSCYDLAGLEFNILSPKEVHSILTGIFKLPVSKGVSAVALRKLQHPMADLIIKYREHAKIITTYTHSLIKQLDSDDRLHTTYSQTSAYTGRLTSSSPNLQNIPRKFELRKCFIPSEGYQLISLDFAQIELKVAAHLSHDTKLLHAFRQGLDIHTETAKAVFQIEITPELRDMAKRMNFGILYGIGAQGLSNYIHKSVKECAELIDIFFETYTELGSYFQHLKDLGLQQGYVTTILNRRIYLPNLKSDIGAVRNAAERNAINSPIQGSAADIMKLAMLDLDTYINSHNLDIHMLLQIHDEIVLEVPEKLMHHLPKLQEVMCKAYELAVPLTCSIDRDKWGSL
jgi:DNA polymerase-1